MLATEATRSYFAFTVFSCIFCVKITFCQQTRGPCFVKPWKYGLPEKLPLPLLTITQAQTRALGLKILGKKKA